MKNCIFEVTCKISENQTAIEKERAEIMISGLADHSWKEYHGIRHIQRSFAKKHENIYITKNNNSFLVQRSARTHQQTEICITLRLHNFHANNTFIIIFY